MALLRLLVSALWLDVGAFVVLFMRAFTVCKSARLAVTASSTVIGLRHRTVTVTAVGTASC